LKFETQIEQGVALTGGNHTGPPCRPTSHTLGPAMADRPCGRPARPLAALQTTDSREQNNTGQLGGPVISVRMGDNAILENNPTCNLFAVWIVYGDVLLLVLMSESLPALLH